jgi:hypothetical protein
MIGKVSEKAWIRMRRAIILFDIGDLLRKNINKRNMKKEKGKKEIIVIASTGSFRDHLSLRRVIIRFFV